MLCLVIQKNELSRRGASEGRDLPESRANWSGTAGSGQRALSSGGV